MTSGAFWSRSTVSTALVSLLLSGIAYSEVTPSSTGVVEAAPPSSISAGPIKLEAQQQVLKLTDDLKVAKAQLKANPEDPEANFLAAAAYSRTPQLDKAFKYMRKVKALLKANQDFEFIDRTIADYESLLSMAPNNPVVLYRLAMGYYFKGYSIEKYPHHFKLGPTGTPTAYYQKAEGAMRKVIDKNPYDIWARNYLGYLMTDNGRDLTRGIPVWQESLQVNDKENAGAYLLLSQAYLKAGDLVKALEYGARGLEQQQATGLTLP